MKPNKISFFISIICALFLMFGFVSVKPVLAADITYYVDNTKGTASDENPGTNPDFPLLTIVKAAHLARAGDTVYVLAGTYAETVFLDAASGIAGSPITFKADPGVVMKGNGSDAGSAFTISGRSYIVIDGFHIDDTNFRGIFAINSNNITIKNNSVTKAGQHNVWGGHQQGIYFDNVTNSLIDGNVTYDNSCVGIRLVRGSNNNVISNNISYGNYSDDPVTPETITDAAGIELVDSDNNTVIHNIVFGNEDSGINMYIGTGPNAGDGSNNNKIIGNLVYGNRDHGIDNHNSSGQIIVGNTVQGNYTSGINLEANSGGATLANNIVSDNGVAPTEGRKAYNIFVDGTSTDETIIDYNLYHLSPSMTPRQIKWGNTGHASLAAFQLANPTQEINGLEGDPLFISPAQPATLLVGQSGGDYHLGAGSAAIDSANSNAPSHPDLDIEGNGRVDDPAIANSGAGTRTYDDRGAYERQSTGPAPLTVTINQAIGQNDPTNVSPINFTVEFSASVTGFTSSDVTVTGSAPGTKTVTVTGSDATYNVAVSGITGSGTVITTIPAGAALDTFGNFNIESASTDNTVTYDIDSPTVTIEQAVDQNDPTKDSPINFTVVFSEVVTGFDADDVTLSGTAGATTVSLSGTGPTYNVAVSGMTGPGTVVASIGAGVAQDLAGNNNTASSSDDNTVTYDNVAPTVTINQAIGQNDPTNVSPINFTVVFSEVVTGFDADDVILDGTAGATTVVVAASSDTTYKVAVNGMVSSGTVTANIEAGAAQDEAGNLSLACTSADNTVTFDNTELTVSIYQAVSQSDPTNVSPINFTVEFNKPVADFTDEDVTLDGTAGATTVEVTGSGTSYNVAVSGMTGSGTVIAGIEAGVAQDSAGNLNLASVSTDDMVTYDIDSPTVTIEQAEDQTDPTPDAIINFTVVFSEVVTGFDANDVTLSGTAGATTVEVTGSGTTYNVAVSGMVTPGTVIASIAAGVAEDAAGNLNLASTSTDNSVTYQPVFYIYMPIIFR